MMGAKFWWRTIPHSLNDDIHTILRTNQLNRAGKFVLALDVRRGQNAGCERRAICQGYTCDHAYIESSKLQDSWNLSSFLSRTADVFSEYKH